MSDASKTPLDEITRLKAELYDKQCEIANLNKKLKDTESELQALRTENRKYQTCNSVRTSKRARSPSIELLDGPQDIQRKPKKEPKIEVLDDVEMVDVVSSQSANIPSSSKIPKREKSSQPKRQLSNHPAASSTSSASVTQLVSSPPRKKRNIEPVEPIIPSMNVDQTASEWPERQFVPILEEAPVESNSSNLSSSSRDSEQHPPVPGPSNSLSSQTLEPLPSPNLPSARSEEQSPSASEVPVVKNEPDLQDEVAVQNPSTQQRSEIVPTSAPAIAQPTSTVAPETSLLTPEPQPQAQTSSRKTKKGKVLKVEQDPRPLSDEDFKKHLDSAKPFPVIDSLDLKVPRDFLRDEYRGSSMTFLQRCHRNPSGPRKRQIVYPMMDLNPCMPSKPGKPGLIFASRHEILEDPPWTLFKRENEVPAVWHYLGEYQCTLSGSMTGEQFASQTPRVQKQWGKLLYKSKKVDVYVAMRARIALRKAGRIPVDDEERQEAIIQGEMNAIKSNRKTSKRKPTPVTEEEIVEALVRGEERIDIIRMECTEYDDVFAKHIETRFPIYREKQEKKKKDNPESGKSSTRNKKKTQKPAVTKREDHREESVSSSSSSASTSSSSRVQSAETRITNMNDGEGVRRSNRPRPTRLRRIQPEVLSDAEEEDDSGSVYSGSDD